MAKGNDAFQRGLEQASLDLEKLRTLGLRALEDKELVRRLGMAMAKLNRMYESSRG